MTDTTSMPRPSPPLVYILLLNYCSLDDTLACVESIRGITYSNLRLLVIDNQSPDGSGKILEQAIPAHEFIQTGENLGYAGGNNLAISRSIREGADYVFIVNPDIRLSPQSVREYVQVMEADQSISALSPIQLSADGQMDEIFRRGMFDRNGHSTPKLPIAEGLQWDVRTLFGAALMLRRRTIEKVGGFDPLYFAYWEEVDLCRRITLHGGRLVVTSYSPVVHLRSYKSKGRDPFRAFLRLKGMHLFQMKNLAQPFSVQVRKTFAELMRCVLVPTANEFGWGRRDHLHALWWLLIHLGQIRKHRASDRLGAAYLDRP